MVGMARWTVGCVAMYSRQKHVASALLKSTEGRGSNTYAFSGGMDCSHWMQMHTKLV